jgi:hypothetical protein
MPILSDFTGYGEHDSKWNLGSKATLKKRKMIGIGI